PTPAPTTSPTGRASATATATSTARPAGPFPYPSPTRGYAPLSVSAALDSSSGIQADDFTLSIDATDGDGAIRLSRIAWGDGAAYQPAHPVVTCPLAPSPRADPGPYQPQPGSLSVAYDHAWRHAGTFPVTVEVTSGGGCGPYPPAVESRTVHLQVSIGDGPETSNGSGSPTVRRVAYGHPGGTRLSLDADPYDTDGWVTKVVVDFGDGTAQVVHDPGLSGCDDGGGAYYPGTQPGQTSDSWTHQYATKGSYTITFVITSTGCDGADAQTFSTKVAARV
ncbi:MAG: hypothetical protein WCD35_12800, partial [Mycobacteriales bacterium]